MSLKLVIAIIVTMVSKHVLGFKPSVRIAGGNMLAVVRDTGKETPVDAALTQDTTQGKCKRSCTKKNQNWVRKCQKRRCRGCPQCIGTPTPAPTAEEQTSEAPTTPAPTTAQWLSLPLGGSPCQSRVNGTCTKCKDTHTLVDGECTFKCTVDQTAKHCTTCENELSCTSCEAGYNVVGPQCEYACTSAETAMGCKRCDGPGRCKQCQVRWVWQPNYTCSEVDGPTYQEFYTYRHGTSFKIDLNGINTASAGGVMRYVHEEIVGVDCCAPQCKRKYEIDRVRRYLVRQKTPERAYRKSGGQFGTFHTYDREQCKWGGPGSCLKEYESLGWYVGCLNHHVDHYFYEDNVWLSFPGLCPSEPYFLKTSDCYLKEPGGNCSSCVGNNDACAKHPNGTVICGCNDNPMGGCQADNVTECVHNHFGEDDCNFILEDAGEIFLNDLVGITDLGYASDNKGYEHFCLEGGIEYKVGNESESTIPFWKGREDVKANSVRTALLLNAFEKKYPNFPFLGEPACEQ